MSITDGPSVSLPRWMSQNNTILGWEFGQGFYCLDCAREKGLGDDAGLSGGLFRAVLQDDLEHPRILRLTLCSGGCHADLAKPYNPT